jgi:enoyl-CoA hydratase/carnithine racemase
MKLTVTHGAGDIVALLERALDEARAGNLEAVVVVTIGERAFWEGARVQGMTVAAERIHLALSIAAHSILVNGVTEDWD